MKDLNLSRRGSRVRVMSAPAIKLKEPVQVSIPATQADIDTITFQILNSYRPRRTAMDGSRDSVFQCAVEWARRPSRLPGLCLFIYLHAQVSLLMFRSVMLNICPCDKS